MSTRSSVYRGAMGLHVFRNLPIPCSAPSVPLTLTLCCASSVPLPLKGRKFLPSHPFPIRGRRGSREHLKRSRGWVKYVDGAQQEISDRPSGLSVKRVLEGVCIPSQNGRPRNPGLQAGVGSHRPEGRGFKPELVLDEKTNHPTSRPFAKIARQSHRRRAIAVASSAAETDRRHQIPPTTSSGTLCGGLRLPCQKACN